MRSQGHAGRWYTRPIFDRKLWLRSVLNSSEAFVFDFDDTLVDERFSIMGRWDTVLKKYQTILNCNDLTECFFEIFNREGAKYKSHVDEMLRYLKLDMNYKNEIIQDFLSQRSSCELIYPKAFELLDLLSSNNIKIALFTNGLKLNQEYRVEISGLKDYFAYIQYGDCAEKKPSSVGFLKLSKSLKLTEKSKFTIIGDSFVDDYQGALNFGAKCILVNSNISNSLPIPVYAGIDELYFDLIEVIN